VRLYVSAVLRIDAYCLFSCLYELLPFGIMYCTALARTLEVNDPQIETTRL